MQRFSSLGPGWLGPVSHAKYNGELFRIYDISDIAVSLRDDLQVRAQFHAAIQHPGLVPFRWLEENVIGTPYQARITLAQLILSGGCPERKFLENILTRINKLFSLVHDQGWIHGDVHPGLIYLTHDGDIVIEGFGRRPQNKKTVYTGHHRYLSPEPMGTISSDLYGIGVVILELALGENVLLGDLLEDLHSAKATRYCQRIKDLHPLCASYIEHALSFHPEMRKEAPRQLASVLDTKPPDEWFTYCQTLAMKTKIYKPDVTDPMDIVFHTEEIFENAFPTSAEITHHELTEELLVDVPQELPNEKKELEVRQDSRTMFVLLAIIAILLFILVYLQNP